MAGMGEVGNEVKIRNFEDPISQIQNSSKYFASVCNEHSKLDLDYVV